MSFLEKEIIRMKSTEKKSVISGNIRQNGMILALVCITLLFGVLTKAVVFRPMNISNLFMQNSYLIFLTIGMFFCILTGNVDLSVGSVVAVTGALLGWMTLEHEVPTTLAVLITVLFGIVVGIFQGGFIAFLNVPPFIVTLAGMLIFRGMTYVILEGQTLSPFSEGFQYFSSGFVFSDFRIGEYNVACLVLILISAIAFILLELKKRRNNIKYGFYVQPIVVTVMKLAVIIGVISAIVLSLSAYKGLPFILIILIAVVIFYSFISNRTVIGRHIYSMGGNMNAARLSGVKTKWDMFIVYINCAFMATISGLVVAGRLNAATAKSGNGFELDAIAACYIGGCSASGGVGTIIGAIVGALVMAILNNGMSILGIGSDLQQVIKGFILLIAVTFDIYSKSKSAK